VPYVRMPLLHHPLSGREQAASDGAYVETFTARDGKAASCLITPTRVTDSAVGGLDSWDSRAS